MCAELRSSPAIDTNHEAQVGMLTLRVLRATSLHRLICRRRARTTSRSQQRGITTTYDCRQLLLLSSCRTQLLRQVTDNVSAQAKDSFVYWSSLARAHVLSCWCANCGLGDCSSKLGLGSGFSEVQRVQRCRTCHDFIYTVLCSGRQ